ncbi:guanylate kinase [Chondromyces apiculatus]|uniref:Guanylate kinase n=1 Tax=Chondromyces apiculatus DSM 436 TaxID=1192034 RepID=A0A017TGE8_9BACT|nr:guanylate kinase [Chondromyces apiculatus]EYF07895.1 Guanylate kinase [Chondromyces apiculatus DSM 436]
MSSEGADDGFLLLIVSSPSGAGKTTLCTRLRKEFPELRFSVSHTTRKPRPTEVDGREYHFVDTQHFEHMVRDNAFAEWARVHGHLYGTSLNEIEIARGSARGILFDIDHQGARQIRAALSEAVCVFILPPSMAELERRLRGRGTEDEQATLRRLQNARGEIEHYGFFDYVIVNDDVDQAYEQLRAIVFAERCRRPRRSGLCERLLAERRGER